jgi:TRAP-type mannitol/chloroaromatic compound transport system permease small subunit
MERLLRISNRLDRAIEIVGGIAMWLILPLIAVTIYDVVTRKFVGFQIWVSSYVGDALNSTKLQEMEWHFHTALFALCLGFGYLRNAHVRVDVLSEGLRPRWKAWIEFLGCLFFLVPYCLVVIYFAYDFALKSYVQNEISASMIGVPHRWIIKSVLLIGLVFALMAGVSVMLRQFALLFGPRRVAPEVEPLPPSPAVDPVGPGLRE